MSGRDSPVPRAATKRVRCAHCRGPVDSLRAVRVRFVADQFCYFCTVNCERQFDAESFETASELTEWTPRQGAYNDEVAEETAPENPHPSQPRVSTPAPQPTTEPGAADKSAVDKSALATEKGTPVSVAPRTEPAGERSEQALRSLALALASSALSVVLLLAADTLVSLWLRLLLEGIATACLWYHSFVAGPEGRTNSRSPLILSSVALVLAAFVTILGIAEPATYVTFGATLAGFSAATLLLLSRYGAAAAMQRTELVQRLQRGVLRVRGERAESVVQSSLRPGEEIVLHAGEIVAADVTVVAGKAEVQPWFGSSVLRAVRNGDFIYAGARLHSGQLRATVRWTGHDTYFLRLTEDPGRAAEKHSPLVKFAEKLTLRGALGAALLSVVAGIVQGVPYPAVLLHVLAILSVLYSPAITRLTALRTTEAVLDALKNGIVIRSAEVLHAAGRISSAVFCARGTLLLGEPELSTIEPLGSLSEAEVLALVAGAEQGAEHPVAVAVHRAARARGVSPDAVRSPRSESGLGVMALASSGKALVVGSRALMLRERISVARAEARITELEATGRTVLLVALGQHLVGLLAFQDGMRAGARAAVQHLLDVGIEPILLSGDRRESCEALGHAVDIDHIRPEVLPAERGHEVERLRASGAVVAVIGRSPVDDIALSSATISVTLPSNGAPVGAFDIELAGDEIQKAAVALRLLHRCRTECVATIAGLVGSGAVVSLVVLLMSAPPALIPGLGGVAVWAAVVLLSNQQRLANG